MYSRLPFVIIIILIISIVSCKKDKAPPPPDPPRLDTLGTGWTKIQLPVNPGAVYFDIFFVNNNVGWVAGKYLYKSIDGGLTWNKQPVLDDTSGFSNLFFLDEFTGWAVGNKALYRTKTGGNTWQEIKINGIDFYWDVQFLNQRLGYLVASNGLYRSIDSGSTWTKIPAITGECSSLYFLDSSQGWVCNVPKPRYTSNAGVDFTAGISLGSPGTWSMQFIDPATGWVAGNNGVWRTVDAGATWIPIKTGFSSDIHFFNKNDGFISHYNEVYNTTNGGQTLTRVAKIAATNGLVELHFTDANHGWVVSYDNFILRYAQ